MSGPRWLPGLKDVLPLIITIAVLTTGQSMLEDSDTGWHIRAGERILEMGEVPRADPFSFSAQGEPWYAWEWLADAAMGEIHRVSGLRGLVAATAIVIAIAFSIAQRLGLRLGGGAFATFGLTALAATASTIHWLVRPHMISCVLAVVFLAVLETGRRDRSTRGLWALVPLSAIWCNLHGAFVLGLALIGIYLVGGLLPGAPRRWPPLQLALVLAAASVATLLNPYGQELHHHLVDYLSSPVIARNIQEFRSPDFHSPAGRLLELWLLAVALAIGVFGVRRDWPRVVLLIGLSHLSLSSHRHVDVFAVCSAPLVAAALAGAGAGARGLAGTIGARIRRMEAIEAGHLGVWGLLASVGVAGLVAFSPATWRWGEPFVFPAAKLPVEAAELLPRLGVKRILCSDSYGGYLIYRWHGEVKVFMDGRSDFYATTGVLGDYLAIMRLKRNWPELVEQYQPDAVLLPIGHPILRWLVLMGGWKLEHEDKTAGILIRQ